MAAEVVDAGLELIKSVIQGHKTFGIAKKKLKYQL